MIKVAILLFDNVEELDAVGPFQVFSSAETVFPNSFEVKTAAVGGSRTVTAVNGLKMVAGHLLDELESVDVLVIPGGVGSRAVAANSAAVASIAALAAKADWVASVCTGARVTLAAGIAVGKRVTTHWSAIEEIRADGRAAAVLDDVRYVVDGNVVHAAGVSAGIDMSLWLVGELLQSGEAARQVQKLIEYYPAPPYAHEANGR